MAEGKLQIPSLGQHLDQERAGDRLAGRRDVLFIGQGASAVGWYRCYLPALALGADWVGLVGAPPKVHYVTGLVWDPDIGKPRTIVPEWTNYSVIVIQQPFGQPWLRFIRGMQKHGIRVLFEVDDYIHGIHKLGDTHDFAEGFAKKYLPEWEMNMRACDGIITSTEFIASRYRKFNRNIYVCENGVDLGRYRLTKPERPTVNIGWAGAPAGHQKALQPWLDAVGDVMSGHDATAFISIGVEFADYLKPAFPTRALSVPWMMLECYPAAMTLFDVALAPAGKGLFYRGKSDLRWVEAGALGVPVIADPGVYPRIEHGVDGFHASTAEEARELLELLVTDANLRFEVGERARLYVQEHRDIRVTSGQWARVFDELVAENAA